MVILIPLKDIIVDPGKPVDLSTFPAAEAIRVIRVCYGFLSNSIEVSLEGDIAVIKTDDRLTGKTQKVKKIFQRGVGEARQGNYRKAVTSFAKVLELLPEVNGCAAAARAVAGERGGASILMIAAPCRQGADWIIA